MTYQVSNGKKLTLFIICGLLLLIFAAHSFGLFRYLQAPQRIQAGYLDLSDWDFERDGNIELDGEWEFFWERLLSYDEIQSGVQYDLYGKVPSTWNTYLMGGQPLPGQGYGTYRLRVKTSLEPGDRLSLLFGAFSSAYRVFINGEEVAVSGTVASEAGKSYPKLKAQAVHFTLPGSEFDLIVQVSNFHHARGGFWETAMLGSSTGIAGLQNKHENWQMFFTGALGFAVLTNLCLFILRHQKKEYLYLALLAVVLIILIDTINQFWVYRIFPEISFHCLVFLQYACISWTVTLLTLLTADLFPTRTSRRIVKGFVVYTGLITLLYMFAPVRVFTGMYVYLNLMGLCQLLLIIYLTVQAMLKRVEGSISYLFGFGVAVYTGIHDTLFVNNIINSFGGKMLYAGITILFFAGSIVHAIRYTQSFNKISTLLHRLRLLNEQRDEFMFNTAHEIRAPLAAVTTLSNELLAAAENNPDVHNVDSLARIKAFSTQASNLVNEILDYSFLQRGGLSLNLEAVNLSTVTDNLLEVYRQIKLADIWLESDIPVDLPLVLADEDRLYQILYNLAGYAVKHASRSNIRIIARTDGIIVEIILKNTGAAISSNQFTAGNDANVDLEGSGIGSTELGLYISRKLIALHGGTIKVENPGSHDLEIRFTLPAVKASPDQNQLENLPDSTGAIAGSLTLPGTGPHILLVDDNINTLNATASILGHSGFAITAVSDGKLAVERVRTDPSIAVVLLDLMIPGTGYEICRDIRSLKTAYDLPILILAVKTAVRDIVVGLDAGANDYLAKPFEKDELLARVQTLAHLKESVDKAIASEISFLQAQIKPHFLHNALSVISSLTVSDPRQAKGLLIHLSEYLRNSFDFAQFNEMVSLAQEIDLVNAYVAIEKARFGARLDFQLNTNGVHATIPRLVLQPLVENAICHGIFHKPNGGQVHVLVEERNDHIYFCVKDNGVGMDQLKADSILTGKGHTGVGLTNINKRLYRYYGSGLIIHSVPGQGTSVSFTVPLQTEDKAKEA